MVTHTKNAAAFWAAAFFAKGIKKRREVEKTTRKAVVAHHLSAYTITADFEQVITKLKTICDKFVNEPANYDVILSERSESKNPLLIGNGSFDFAPSSLRSG